MIQLSRYQHEVPSSCNNTVYLSVSFDVSWPQHLVAISSLFMHALVPPRTFWNFDVFIASFPFWISRCIIVPNLEHTTFLISFPNGSGFLKIKEKCGKSPLGDGTESYGTHWPIYGFLFPWSNFPARLLNPSINPRISRSYRYLLPTYQQSNMAKMSWTP